jgi:hypothetical protein
MTLSAQKILFPLIVLSALLGFGWVLIVYVLSFHGAQWLIDCIEPRPVAYRPAMRRVHRRPIPYRPLQNRMSLR